MWNSTYFNSLTPEWSLPKAAAREPTTDYWFSTTTTRRTTTYISIGPYPEEEGVGVSFYPIALCSFAIIAIVIALVMAKECILSRKRKPEQASDFSSNVRDQISQNGQNSPNQRQIATVYNSDMAYNEKPPAYDTLIQMELPSYEEIASKK